MTPLKQNLRAVLCAFGLFASCVVHAADDAAPPPSAPAQRSAADLEKLAAPMALYPDPLIAVMLPASAYPVEVVQVARFVANTNNLAMLDDQPWDENVKAVARFPSVIQKMSDELGWTAELGQAFVQQPSELMDAIQSLRAKAQSVGTLQTTPQQVVVVTNAVVERTYETQIVYVTNTIVQIMPANPQVIYVPVYSPTIVYYPPPAYVYNPLAPLVVFGAGIAVGAIIANNHCNWYYGGVYRGPSGVVVWGGSGGRYPYYPPPPHYRPPPYYPPPGYRPPPPGYRPPGYPPPGAYPPGGRPPVAVPYTSQQWQPDQSRMRQSGSSGTSASIANMEARGWGSATTRPATQPGSAARPAPSTGGIGAQPSTGTAGNRPSTGAVGNRPATGTAPSVNQPTIRPTPSVGNAGGGVGAPRPAPAATQTRPASGRPSSSGSAFGDLSSGSSARVSSNRGASSRGSGGSSSGGRR
jgi:uncharacterized protein DUF3300